MIRRKGRTRALCILAAALMAGYACASPGAADFSRIPDRLSLTAGSNVSFSLALPVSAELESGSTKAQLEHTGGGIDISAGEVSGKANLIFRLLGILPVKEVEVNVSEEKILVPGGKSVGIALETAGLIVIGTSDIGANASPAGEAGLRPGDIITHVDGAAVSDAQQLTSMLAGRSEAVLTVSRDGEAMEVSVEPVSDKRDNTSKIGAWVRSSTAGVGTLTYIDPEDGSFAALGHPISDMDTGVVMPVKLGGLYENEIVEIHAGESGAPGEIVGDFFTNERMIGEVTQNTQLGIYGKGYSADYNELIYPEGLPVASRDEVKVGPAQILTTVDEEVQAFDCEIERADAGKMQPRPIVVHITDEELLSKTGGIVQGMSGSPIIQDGKLVGAVTHVLVNDPTRGYGIFIENMLEAA